MKKFLYIFTMIISLLSTVIFQAKASQEGGHWLAKETADINEDYAEAVYKVEHSTLSAEVKNILLSQAKRNKELALKQAKETSNLKIKNKTALEKFKKEIRAEKKNRKAVKAVNDIL